LQFSNIENGQLEAHYSETDIAQLTQELASNFNSIAEKLGLDYIIDVPNPDKFKQALGNEVYLDHDMFETIVYNLCTHLYFQYFYMKRVEFNYVNFDILKVQMRLRIHGLDKSKFVYI